jgi:hypothetical protein
MNRRRRVFNFPFSLRKLAGLAFALSVISIPLRLALAHKGETHTPKKEENHSDHAAKELEKVMGSINESYIANVKPVFKKSCFDCHSSNTNYPWYSRVPGAKQLIESDIAEAKEHLDMSADFPFKGHGAPKEDLEAIRDSVNEKTMPPFRYRMMHWSSGLNDSERTTILRWVEESLAQLESKQTPSH